MADAPKPSSSVKLVLLGEAAVGKVSQSSHYQSSPVVGKTLPYILSLLSRLLTQYQSSLVLRFVNDDFQENKEPTIGGKFLYSSPNATPVPV